MSTTIPAPTYRVVSWLPNPQTQSQKVTLTVNGAPLTLNLTITYNLIAGYWVLRIQDTYGNIMLDSIPCITGQYPAGSILSQYQYLGIGNCVIVCNSPNPTSDYPGPYNFGTQWLMVWF